MIKWELLIALAFCSIAAGLESSAAVDLHYCQVVWNSRKTQVCECKCSFHCGNPHLNSITVWLKCHCTQRQPSLAHPLSVAITFFGVGVQWLWLENMPRCKGNGQPAYPPLLCLTTQFDYLPGEFTQFHASSYILEVRLTHFYLFYVEGISPAVPVGAEPDLSVGCQSLCQSGLSEEKMLTGTCVFLPQ